MKAVALLVVLLLALVSAHVMPLNYHKVPIPKADKPTDAPWSTPLDGGIDHFGEFFVNISIGYPAQTLRVQIDTGSTDLVVYATGCTSCPNATNMTWFDPKLSKTLRDISCYSTTYTCDTTSCWNFNQCPLDIQYGGGGSINGYAVTDGVTFGPYKAKASLGLIQQESGPFELVGVDGCWGFAYSGLSSWGDDPVIDHMAGDLNLYDAFSMCLVPENPVMDIGVDYSGDGSFQWTDVTDPSDWYTVDMEDFYVDGVSLGVSHWDLNINDVIVDSGTTLVITNKKLNDAFTARLQGMCDKTPLVGICNATVGKTLFDGYCYNMSEADVAMFPNVSTSLKGTGQLVIPPKAYLWEGTNEPGMYCFGFDYIDDQDDLPLILGDIFIQNYHVVFDRVTNKIGFGSLDNCPTV